MHIIAKLYSAKAIPKRDAIGDGMLRRDAIPSLQVDGPPRRKAGGGLCGRGGGMSVWQNADAGESYGAEGGRGWPGMPL